MHCLSLTRKHEISLQRLSIFFLKQAQCNIHKYVLFKLPLVVHQTYTLHANTAAAFQHPARRSLSPHPIGALPRQFINSDNNNNNKKEESNMETRYLPINTSSSWKGKEGKNIQGLSLSSQKSPFFTSLSMSGRRKEKNWTQWVVRRRRGKKEKKNLAFFQVLTVVFFFSPLYKTGVYCFVCLLMRIAFVHVQWLFLAPDEIAPGCLPPLPSGSPPLLLFPPTALLLLL